MKWNSGRIALSVSCLDVSLSLVFPILMPSNLHSPLLPLTFLPIFIHTNSAFPLSRFENFSRKSRLITDWPRAQVINLSVEMWIATSLVFVASVCVVLGTLIFLFHRNHYDSVGTTDKIEKVDQFVMNDEPISVPVVIKAKFQGF